MADNGMGGDLPNSTTHVTSSKSSLRRTNKPLMEKKRRARINHCLTELKSLIFEATQKEGSQFTKLEKADILEMTVQHLKLLQQQQQPLKPCHNIGDHPQIPDRPSLITKYHIGYSECANEVFKFLDSSRITNPELKIKVQNHLLRKLDNENVKSPPNTDMCDSSTESNNGEYKQDSAKMVNNYVMLNNNSQFMNANLNSGVLNTLQLIPTSLKNGQLAFVIASPSAVQQIIPVYATEILSQNEILSRNKSNSPNCDSDDSREMNISRDQSPDLPELLPHARLGVECDKLPNNTGVSVENRTCDDNDIHLHVVANNAANLHCSNVDNHEHYSDELELKGPMWRPW